MTRAPITVNVTRGPAVESEHAVDAVLMDGRGGIVRAWGDTERVFYPRSSVKLIQALPVIESGAADAFGFDDEALALACASHDGTCEHERVAAGMLRAAGVSQEAYECGPQTPAAPSDRAAFLQAGREPLKIINGCSGKHAGMMGCAVHAGHPVSGYSQPEHPHQVRIAQIFTELSGAAHNGHNCAIDGCAVPTYAIPLSALARSFAVLSDGSAISADRKAAADRLMAACFKHPEMVAGERRVDTILMRALPGRAFAKTGAEGVCIAVFPELGMALALKNRDGAMRAAWASLAAIVRDTLAIAPGAVPELDTLAGPPITNTNKTAVGQIQVIL